MAIGLNGDTSPYHPLQASTTSSYATIIMMLGCGCFEFVFVGRKCFSRAREPSLKSSGGGNHLLVDPADWVLQMKSEDGIRECASKDDQKESVESARLEGASPVRIMLSATDQLQARNRIEYSVAR